MELSTVLGRAARVQANALVVITVTNAAKKLHCEECQDLKTIWPDD